MRNIIFLILEIIVSYLTMIILSKKYKTDGLYVYGIIATFILCIMSLKMVNILEISMPLGLGVGTSLIVAGNIITQKRGPDEIKNYLVLIIITTIIGCCFLNLSGIMTSSDYNYYANKSFDNIFKYNIRMYISLLVSLLPSIYISSKIYYKLKIIQNKIILSNIFSIIIVEFIDNIIFVIFAYLYEYQTIDIILCIIFRYIIKTIIGIIGTSTIYIANK